MAEICVIDISLFNINKLGRTNGSLSLMRFLFYNQYGNSCQVGIGKEDQLAEKDNVSFSLTYFCHIIIAMVGHADNGQNIVSAQLVLAACQLPLSIRLL